MCILLPCYVCVVALVYKKRIKLTGVKPIQLEEHAQISKLSVLLLNVEMEKSLQRNAGIQQYYVTKIEELQVGR